MMMMMVVVVVVVVIFHAKLTSGALDRAVFRRQTVDLSLHLTDKLNLQLQSHLQQRRSEDVATLFFGVGTSARVPAETKNNN
jgi:hypothetical protein